MTSKERLDRCYRHLETDRPGIHFRGINAARPTAEDYRPLRELAVRNGDLQEDYYLPTIDNAKAGMHKTLQQYYPDFLTLYEEPAGAEFTRHVTILHTPAGDLTQATLVGRTKPSYIEKHFIQDERDAQMYMSLPYELTFFNADEFYNKVRALGDRGIVLVKTGNNPAGAIVTLLGSENFAMWTQDSPEMLDALIARKAAWQRKLIDQLMDSGVGPYFAFSGQEYLTPPMHGRADFDRYNTAHDKSLYDRIHERGGLVFIHCHGPLKAVLDSLLEVGCDVLHPIEPPPMGNVTAKEAKDAFQNRICIEGNIQIGDMYDLSAEEVYEQTKQLIRDAFFDNRGLIVCPSAAPYIKGAGQKAYETYAAMCRATLGDSMKTQF